MPFLFQFCKNLTTIEMYEILDNQAVVNVVKIKRTKGYVNEEYGLGRRRQGSELVNHQIQTFTFKPTQANWKDCEKKNPKSPQFELIRSLKFEPNVSKKMEQVSNQSLDFLHSWGPVYKSTRLHNGRREELDRGLKISCWHHKDNLNQIHICEVDSQGKPSSCYRCPRLSSQDKWKQVRWQIVHLNLPLFDTQTFFQNFRAQNKSFISSVMPLAMLTNNRFFVSGDFHVQENRKQFKSQPQLASEWNKSVAGSIFELLIDTFSYLEDELANEALTMKKFGSINLLPERLANWFSDLTGLQPFIRKQGWDACEHSLINSVWNLKWVVSTDGSLTKPSETFIPFEKDRTYSSSLSETLVKLGLNVASEEFCLNISKSSEAMTLMKQQFQFNSPYMELKQDLQNRLVKALEEFNSEHFNSIRTNTAVHLCSLRRGLCQFFSQKQIAEDLSR